MERMKAFFIENRGYGRREDWERDEMKRWIRIGIYYIHARKCMHNRYAIYLRFICDAHIL